MRTQLKAGAELDILTQDELRTVLTELASGYLREPQRDRIEAGGTTNASGNMTVDLYQARAGYVFLLLRLAIVLPGSAYTFGAPYTNAAGYHNLLRSTDVVDGLSYASGSGQLPFVYTESDARAIDIRDGELLQLQMFGGPASTGVLVHGHGLLLPLQPSL